MAVRVANRTSEQSEHLLSVELLLVLFPLILCFQESFEAAQVESMIVPFWRLSVLVGFSILQGDFFVSPDAIKHMEFLSFEHFVC